MLSEYAGLPQDKILEAPVAVVTSRFHLRRAERLADRMGFTDIKGVASKTPVLKIPHAYVREICAYVKLNLRILLRGVDVEIVPVSVFEHLNHYREHPDFALRALSLRHPLVEEYQYFLNLIEGNLAFVFH